MIRTGERGEGKWRRATWDEALDYTADKLKQVIKAHGPQIVVFQERTNLSTHVSKTFMKAIGSPNHCTHDALCKGSVNTACRSLFGYTDAQMGMDLKNSRHIVLYGRNPCPIKALIVNRFDPLKSIPDTNQMKKALNKLDLQGTFGQRDSGEYFRQGRRQPGAS